MYRVAAQTCTNSLSFPCHRHLPEPQIPMKPSATRQWVSSLPGIAVPTGSVKGCSRQCVRGTGQSEGPDKLGGGGRRPTTSHPGTAHAARGRAEAWWGSVAPWAPSPRAETRRRSGLPRRPRGTSRPAARTAPSPPGRRPVRSLPRCPRSPATALGADLDGLPVVHFHHVKIETVNPFPRRDESAPLRVEVAADIH